MIWYRQRTKNAFELSPNTRVIRLILETNAKVGQSENNCLKTRMMLLERRWATFNNRIAWRILRFYSYSWSANMLHSARVIPHPILLNNALFLAWWRPPDFIWKCLPEEKGTDKGQLKAHTMLKRYVQIIRMLKLKLKIIRSIRILYKEVGPRVMELCSVTKRSTESKRTIVEL